MEYIYENKANSPDLDNIHNDIASSAMTDKTIEWCRWDENTKILKIIFINTLSSGDKTLLDTIVSDNS